MRNSTAKEVTCCRCGKETLFYTVAPYGSVDDGDLICVECFDGGPQDWKTRAEKAEAELAKQAPLIEAVMRAILYDSEVPGSSALEFSETDEKTIYRAALALREGEKP